MIAPPEVTIKIERLEVAFAWARIFEPHSPETRKELIMLLHALAEISDTSAEYLIATLNLEAV